MEGALRSGERAAETLMLQECGLLEKPASKPSVPVRVALAAPTRESAAFEREVATPFKMRAAGDASEGKSPFLGRDLFTGEAAAEWEPRVAALVAERVRSSTPSRSWEADTIRVNWKRRKRLANAMARKSWRRRKLGGGIGTGGANSPRRSDGR